MSLDIDRFKSRNGVSMSEILVLFNCSSVELHKIFKLLLLYSFNRICVAISRVDGALKPWSAFLLGDGNSKQKPAYLDLPVPVM